MAEEKKSEKLTAAEEKKMAEESEPKKLTTAQRLDVLEHALRSNLNVDLDAVAEQVANP